MKVACIIPSRGRPAQLRRCVDQFFATTQGQDVSCVVVLDGMENNFDGSKAIPLVNDTQKGAIASWNLGLKTLSQHDAFIPGADDLIWHSGWLDAALAALKVLPGQYGLVGFNDLDRTDQMATHFLVTRQCIIDVMGGVLAIPAYHHYWTDPEMNARAILAGCYIWCKESIVEHRSAMNGKAAEDDTYRQASQWFKEDEEIFNRRRTAGFPDDFEPVLT